MPCPSTLLAAALTLAAAAAPGPRDPAPAEVPAARLDDVLRLELRGVEASARVPESHARLDEERAR